MAESATQARARLTLSQQGWRVFRNNIGVMLNEQGVPVRFGLANDSKRMNTEFKSGDLIGVRPVIITPDMVGKLIGQFASIECKHPDWKPRASDERFRAQMNWANLINSMGGYAAFTTDGTTLWLPEHP